MSPYTRKAITKIEWELAKVVRLSIDAHVTGRDDIDFAAFDAEYELIKMIREAIENKPTH